MTLPPLSLYVHIPWCVRKCSYCDFNSHAQRDDLPETAYIDTLLEDLDTELIDAQGRPLHSIFIGGGTPSLFSADAIARLLAEIEKRIAFVDDIEITMEANPGTFEQARFRGYRDAGVNRLSIGVQSFSSDCLQALGRIHNGDEAITAARYARELFPRLNLDLMHGLPGQSPEQAMADLRQAIALAPDHLSWYQLTIEPNTEFHARPPQLPVDEALWEIQERGQALLAESGYHQYEVSAYSQPGSQARHNLNYWQFGDYIGIGAGAHGKLTRHAGGSLRVIRRHKIRQPAAYMKPDRRLAGENEVPPGDLLFEFMLNALRLTKGVDVQLVRERTGLDLAKNSAIMQVAKVKGLLENSDEMIEPTQHGRLFLNDLLALFLPE